MSTSDVTKDGIEGERQGRSALVGQGLDGHRTRRGRRSGRNGRNGRGGRRGERPVVPEAEFTSYYGKPILNQITWEPRDIAGYFFLGGLAGAGSMLAAGAQLTGRARMARAMKVSSLVAIAGSTAALIHDLGRPERFHHMLRVAKLTSPMSVGSWLLAAYGPAAGAAVVAQEARRQRWLGRRLVSAATVLDRAATAAAAGLGPGVLTYTAVLACDTAVPSWHEGYRQMPFLFAGSGLAAASGMALAVSPTAQNGPARSAALAGGLLEIASAKVMEHRLGLVGEPYSEGQAGRYMRAAEALTVAGTATAVLLAGRSRPAAVASGAALLAASACTRFGVFHAGRQSAEDPRYTVIPQRRRGESDAAR
ncbi:NrfD/PsrC family molybdoenzyme membrane anchor subunit [Actinomadura gamaensis]|uniref:NrfD/PsrC family molybdoenzyme membrane anchor subunit n=1 Tax=Actinomadura gamaensis TaxID=1763541 RepID=A0ABV9U014_9ACTN